MAPAWALDLSIMACEPQSLAQTALRAQHWRGALPAGASIGHQTHKVVLGRNTQKGAGLGANSSGSAAVTEGLEALALAQFVSDL